MFVVKWLLARMVENVDQWPLLLEYKKIITYIFNIFFINFSLKSKEINGFRGRPKYISNIFFGIKYWNKNGNLV